MSSYEIDKQWMKESNQRSARYIKGVKKFIDFVVENGGKKTVFSCPCTCCRNGKGQIPLDDIEYHLLKSGFDQSYTVWRFHGESIMEKGNQQSTRHSISNIDEFNHPRMEDLVDDARKFHNYEATNSLNDHIASDNIGEHPEVNTDSQTPRGKTYKSLHTSAREPLYPSCPKEKTTLYAIVKLNNIKTQYGFSDNGVTTLIELLRELLPEGNTLPAKYSDIKNIIKEVGMDYITYDACINDCILYWKEHESRLSCPICNEPRYKKRFNEERRTTKVPQKTLRHFPLIPRLRRLYSISWIANAMTWHHRAKSHPNVIRHPRDTSHWRAANLFDLDWEREPRNVTLGISTNGFNPHGSLSNSYSCWPVIVVPYNLPPSMCMKREFSMLSLLISGPKAPGKDIDVYLQPLVDELKKLWHEGVLTYDSYDKSDFTMRARVLWAIHDHPAFGTLSGCITHGYYACPICGEGTCSEYLPHSKKICYMGHRRFLPSNHKFRDDKNNFNNKVEHGQAPWPLTGFQVEKEVANIYMKLGKGKAPVLIGRKRKNRNEEVDDVNTNEVTPTNTSVWFRRFILYDLPNWKANIIRHNVDVMHTEKNVTEHLINTIMGHKEKSKDGLNARKDLKAMDMKQNLWLSEDFQTGKTTMPMANFALSKDEKIRFCTVLKNLKVPSNFSSNFHNNVSITPPEIRNLKSHDYHVIMQQLLPLLLLHAYPQHMDLRNAIHRISLFFNILCSKVINREHLLKAKMSLVEAMCVLEKHFPPAFFDISIHLRVHLADEALTCGPVRYRWMYPFERLMKTYKGYVRNKRYIEGCIAEGYILQEASLYCMEYMPDGGDGTHKHTREAFLDDDDEFADETPLTNGKDVTLTQLQFEQVRRWVLNKYDGLDEWRKKYDSYVKSNKSQGRKGVTSVKPIGSFTLWLRDELVKANNVDSTLWRLVNGPNFKARSYMKYRVNGFVFSPSGYEERLVTQDSGVSMRAITKFRASRKDKNYKEAFTTYYGVIKQIIELDYFSFKQTVFYCDWVKVEDKANGCKIDPVSNLIMVNLGKLKSKDSVDDEPFILASEASQVFYSKDPTNNK